MRTIGFIGAYDKTDLIMYIAKILATANIKVLVLDTTLEQKTRYIVPTISHAKMYITDFEKIDVAVGFKSLENVCQYLGIDFEELNYDVVLVDINQPEVIQNFEIEENDQNLFVTGFDLYSIKRGMDMLRMLTRPTRMYKVLVSKNMSKVENDYLDYISSNYYVEWDDTIFNVPLEVGNYAVSIENEMTSRIKMKNLSGHYKGALQYIIETIFSEFIPAKEVSRIFKYLEKEV